MGLHGGFSTVMTFLIINNTFVGDERFDRAEVYKHRVDILFTTCNKTDREVKGQCDACALSQWPWYLSCSLDGA